MDEYRRCEGKDVRVLAPARQAIYLGMESGQFAFGLTELPGLPSLDGADGTYALNSTFANEFFFQCDGVDMPWEAALDGRGSGLVEASTPRLRYRKLFVWGSHPGGRHWQEFLSEPGQAYLEIQAGLAPTQVHGLPMPAGAAWEWVQVFGALKVDPAHAHDPDFVAAARHTDAVIRNTVTPDQLAAWLHAGRAQAAAPPAELLHLGMGWGALETARRVQAGEPLLPPACTFPAATLGAEQYPWLALLKTGSLPTSNPAGPPGAWLVQDEWLALLRDAPAKNWLHLLHEGVATMEHGDTTGAYHGLGIVAAGAALGLGVAQPGGGTAAARGARSGARLLPGSLGTGQPPGAAVASVGRGVPAGARWPRGEFAEAHQLYESLPATLQVDERIQILHGRVALALDQLDVVAAVLTREYTGSSARARRS